MARRVSRNPHSRTTRLGQVVSAMRTGRRINLDVAWNGGWVHVGLMPSDAQWIAERLLAAVKERP